MDADRPLKKLFQLRAGDLLALTGDRGARVVSRQIPELAAVTRRLDFVIKLERQGEVYLRHFEFETRFRGHVASRMYECDAGLAARYRLPVVSTAIILIPPAPPGLVYLERVGGRVVCRRRIRVVRLWRMKPATAMRLGAGGAALVGLMGRPDIRIFEAAARRIVAGSPPSQYPDLGEAVGRAKGELAAARSLCADLAEQHHAAALPRLAPAIDGCRDASLLHRRALAAPRLADDEFVRLVLQQTPVAAPGPRKPSPARTRRTNRARAVRHSRRAKTSRHR